MVLATYVDNIIVFSLNKQKSKSLFEDLKRNRLDIRDLRDINTYLGVEVVRDR